MAQETYESANIATEDVNGTARYVGMGGAMEALGADISTISSNPASIGLFRKSGINVTAGATSLSGSDGSVAKEFKFDNKKSPMSLDQLGFVYAHEYDSGNFLNVAFTYRKSRNFNQILSHTGALNGASLNKIPYQKSFIGNANGGGYYLDYNDKDDIIGYRDQYSDDISGCFSQVDYLFNNAFTIDPDDGNAYYYNGKDYLFVRDQKGYIGNYDINISGNQNQVYSENIVDSHDNSAGYYDLYDTKYISGHGYDLSAGIIFRPIDASPLRIGLSISTPTWYQLKTNNYTRLENYGYDNNINKPIGMYNKGEYEDNNEYKVSTPWKFGASLGYTIGNNIALGASYNYSDYSAIDNRYITSYTYYDWYEAESANSKSDKLMNHHTENSLQGVSTLKLGAEYKPSPELAIRLGYNYVSPMYNDNGFKDGSVWSPGSWYASATDYTNWKSTNRITCGVGYQIDKFTIDLAYQYSVQNGDFYPFMSYDSSKTFVNSVTGETMSFNNVCDATEVSNKRHQVLLTLGYRF